MQIKSNTLVESDHKPLQSILAKSLLTAPKHIQWMMLRLQQFDKNIRYKPSMQMCIVNSLSRAHMQREEQATKYKAEVIYSDIEAVN